MSLAAQVVHEFATFLANSPSPEEIIAFQASPECTERFYALIEAEKAGEITNDEREELHVLEAISHIMLHTKAAAKRRLLREEHS